MGLGLGLGLNKPRGLIYFQNQFSMKFDGSDDRIFTDADTVAQPTTYSFWSKSSETGRNRGVFGHGGDNIGGFHFSWSSGMPLLYLSDNFYWYWNANAAQGDGKWHHWVVYSDTNDITNSKLYCDGVLQTPNTASSNTSGSANAYTQSLTIGSDRRAGGNSFLGSIDEFAVFDRELTQAEITRMYNTYYTNNIIQNSDFDEIGDEEVTNGDFSQIGNEEVTNGDFSEIGSELVTNGNFANNSGWSGASSIANGQLTKTSNGLAYQSNNNFTSGKQYYIVVDVEVLKPSLTVYLYGLQAPLVQGINTIYLEAGSANNLVGFNNGFSGTGAVINSISIKEVGQDWTFFNGSSMGDNAATIVGDGSAFGYIQQTNVLEVDKFYKITADVTINSGLGLKFQDGASNENFGFATTSGVYTFYGKATNAHITIGRRAGGTAYDSSVNSISVKEVGQGWSLVGDFKIDDTKAFITSASQYSQITSQIGSTFLKNGKSYKLEADITTSITNALAYRVQGGSIVPIATSDIVGGKYTAYFTMTQDGYFWFQTTGSFTGLNATIDNVSVKEVGQHWSAKDGLITSVENGKLFFDNSTGNGAGGAFQNIGLVAGRQYQMTATMQLLTGSSNGTFNLFTSTSTGTGQSTVYNGGVLVVGGAAVTETFTFTPASGDVSIQLYADESNATYTISNVVVQQLKHQATNLLVNSGDYQSANPLLTSTKSMFFDGIDDYLSVGSDCPTGNFTVTSWVKKTGTGGWYAIFSASTQIWFGLNDNGRILAHVGGPTLTATGVVDINKWHHCTLTWNGTTSIIYVDGVQVVTSTSTNNPAATAYDIGKLSTSNQNYFDGSITELGLYDRALTSLEVASLYNQGVPTNLLVNRNNYQSGNPTVFNTKQVDFDGVDDYMNVGVLPNSFTTSYTLSAWLWTDSSSGSRQIISTGQGAFSQIYQSGTGLKLQILGGTGYNNITISGSYFGTDYQSKWVHLVLIYNGSTIKAYRNGIENASASLSGTLGSITQEANIGRWRGGGEHWNGKMSQIGLFSSALTADEVSSLYNHGLPIDLTTDQAAYASSSNLVNYWRMGSGTLDSFPLIADQTNATLGSNLVLNGTFETPVSNNQWFNFSSPTTAERSTTYAYEGTHSYHIVGDTTNDGTQASASQFTGDYTVGDVVKITAYVYPITAYFNQIKTGVNGTNRSITSAYYNLVLNEWNKVEYYVTISSAGNNYISFLIAGSSGEFYLDNVSAQIVGGNPAIMTLMPSTAIQNGSPYANFILDSSNLLAGALWNANSNWDKTVAGKFTTAGGATADINQGHYLPDVGKSYVVSFEILSISAGSFYFRFGGVNGIFRNTIGVHTETITATSTDRIRIKPETSLSVGSVTNITAREVNTGLQGYWKMGDGINDEFPVIYDQTNPTLGSEIVVNGNGSSTTGWGLAYANTTLSINNNNLRATANGAGAYGTSQSLSLDITKKYIIKATINVDNASGGAANLRIATNSNLSSGTTTLSTATGTSTTILSPSAATMYIGVVDTANSPPPSNYVEIDNISVREISGNPATMTAMPEGNITNQFPLTKLRNYYRMGDGALDSKFTSYPTLQSQAPYIFQDQTSPNLAHIPTTNLVNNNDVLNVNTGVTQSTVSPPSGYTGNAYRITEDTTNGQHFASQSIGSVTSGVNYTMSLYVKSTYSSIRIYTNTSQINSNLTINFTNETVTLHSGLRAGIEDAGGGWYRVNWTQVAQASGVSLIYLVVKDLSVYTGSTSNFTEYFGVQLEAQSQATPFLKSSGVNAVRKSSTTNLLNYSEDFSTFDQVQDIKLTPNATTSPTGASNATKFESIALSGTKVRDNVSVVSGRTYTFSVFCKNIDATLIKLLAFDGVTSFNNIVTSEVSTTEWTRVSVTFTSGNTTSSGQVQIARDLPNGESAFFWGAQFEEQTQAETYAPTKGIPVTIDLFKENNYGHTQGGIIEKDVPKDQ